MMDKIIKFCKEKYKILIPMMVVFVLLITIYFLYREYKYDTYRNKKEVEVYQYFGGIKNEYTGIVTYNLKNVIIDVSAKNKKIEYDATPIYYKNEDKIIFPNIMSIIFPLRDVSQYKLYKYSLYEKIDGIHMITNVTKTNQYSHFFLFDGEGLYFFPDEITLKIDGMEYTKLGAGSYVSLVGGYTATYYDKEKDVSEILEVEGKTVSVVSDTMEVNLSQQYCLHFNTKILLSNPYNLDSITN